MTARRPLALLVVIFVLTSGAACSNGTSSTAGPSASSGTTSSTPMPTGSASSSLSSATSSTSSATSKAAPVATESNPPGDIPDNQVFVRYAPPAATFSIKVPEGWARTAQGGVTSFTDKLNRIEISSATATREPTVASGRDTVIPVLESRVPRFGPGKVTTVTRKTGRGVLVTYEGDSATDPVTGKVVRDAFEQYLFFHGGRVVTLRLIGPVNADNVDPWRIVSDSLRWS